MKIGTIFELGKHKLLRWESKNLGLISKLIIFDPFGGSGTTLFACEELGRTEFICEVDPHGCKSIVDRWNPRGTV